MTTFRAHEKVYAKLRVKEFKEKTNRTNDVGENIEKRIEDGLTLIFASAKAAYEYALLKRSYVYWVYENGKTNGEYAVPN